MEMRLRFPELLVERDMTPYALAKASHGRIGLSALYRLVRSKGRARYLDAELLDAICDTLHIEPGELLEREKRKKAS